MQFRDRRNFDILTTVEIGFHLVLSRRLDNFTSLFVSVVLQLKAFKVRPFWEFECGPEAGRKALAEAEDALVKERKKLDTATHLCALFDFPDLIKESQRMIAGMESNCKLMYKVSDAL